MGVCFVVAQLDMASIIDAACLGWSCSLPAFAITLLHALAGAQVWPTIMHASLCIRLQMWCQMVAVRQRCHWQSQLMKNFRAQRA